MRYKVPRSFRDTDVGALSPALVEQVKISVLLSYGFALSLVTLGGLGSLAACVIGWRARSRIKNSNHRLAGLRLAWWCITVGALQAIAEPLAIISRVLHEKGHT